MDYITKRCFVSLCWADQAADVDTSLNGSSPLLCLFVSKKAACLFWLTLPANARLPSVAAETKSSHCQSSVGQEWDKLSNKYK
jgi:hypothetical protein